MFKRLSFNLSLHNLIHAFPHCRAAPYGVMFFVLFCTPLPFLHAFNSCIHSVLTFLHIHSVRASIPCLCSFILPCVLRSSPPSIHPSIHACIHPFIIPAFLQSRLPSVLPPVLCQFRCVHAFRSYMHSGLTFVPCLHSCRSSF